VKQLSTLRISPRLVTRFAVAFSIAGVFISTFLTLSYLGVLVLPCGTGDGCELVKSSVVATLLGLPLPAYGLVLNVLLTSLTVKLSARPHDSFRVERLAYALSAVGAGCSLLLMAYSTLGLKVACAWCIASAIAFTGVYCCYAALAATRARRDARATSDLSGSVACIAVATVLAGVFYWVKILNFRPLYDSDAIRQVNMVELAPRDAARIGDSKSRLTAIYFGDFTCPSCRQSLPAFSALATRPHSGIDLVYRHYPVHDGASELAMLSELAHQQGQFWRFAKAVVDLPAGPVDGQVLESLSKGLSKGDRARAAKLVARDLSLARKLGLASTPTIVVAASGYWPRVLNASQALRVLSSRSSFPLLRR
jgi:protein-disulfide isomerase